MKKIGIVTFHRAKNYGAMLQAYALQEELKKYAKVEIVDYRNDCIEESYYSHRREFKQIIKSALKWICFPNYMYRIVEKNKRFQEFQTNYYCLSDRYSKENVEAASAKFDLFISGSDQIWNMKWSNHDWYYFLAFTNPEKRYSYAASIGKELMSGDEKIIKEYLDSYRAILVREKTGAEVIRELGVQRNVDTVCDPVFFLNQNEWINKLQLKQITRKKYVLLYLVAKETFAIEYARKIANEYGLEIVYINQLAIRKMDKSLTSILDSGPIEFLEYILNASCVVTTSFHALAFSLIMNIPFYYELCRDGGNDNSRLINLENIFEIEDRRIRDIETDVDLNLNWQFINERLRSYSNESREKLIASIDC